MKMTPDGPCLEVELEQAIKSGWLSADFFGTGRWSGDSIGVRLVASGKAGVALCPVLKRRLILEPGDRTWTPDGVQEASATEAGYQRMIITGPLRPADPPSYVRRDGRRRASEEYSWDWELKPKASVSVGAEVGNESFAIALGYCVDENLEEPEPGLSMHIGGIGIDTEGVDVVLAKSEGYPEWVVADAVWAVRADSESHEICRRAASSMDREESRQLVSLLKSTGLDPARYKGIHACLAASGS